MLGDPSGLDVLDLACGEGEYARKFRRRGAGLVVGADLSGEMIALANEEEAREPLGIRYLQSPAEELGVIGAFDVVTAVYLLHYAPTRERLSVMCRTIAGNLKPGGRLVAFISNIGPGVPRDTSKYGYTPTRLRPIGEGEPYGLSFLSGEDAFEIQNYFYAHRTYEEALAAEGFHSLQWHIPTVSEEGVREFGEEYWRDFLEIAPIIGITCTR
jgi:SAM-dependent methyltransferase